jgi:hypothetical protein
MRLLRSTVIVLMVVAVAAAGCRGEGGDNVEAQLSSDSVSPENAGDGSSEGGSTDAGADTESVEPTAPSSSAGAAASVDYEEPVFSGPAAEAADAYRQFVSLDNEARLSGDISVLATVAGPAAVTDAEAWFAENSQQLADSAFSGVIEMTETPNLVDVVDQGAQGYEVIDCLEREMVVEINASGRPSYTYIDQSAFVRPVGDSWIVDQVEVRRSGKLLSGLTCIPEYHRQQIAAFMVEFDTAFDAMTENPAAGVPDSVQAMVVEALAPTIAQGLNVYVNAGVAPVMDGVSYKYRVVGVDTDVDSRMARIQRCARYEGGDRFVTLDTGAPVDMSDQGAVNDTYVEEQDFIVQFRDEGDDRFTYRLFGPGSSRPESPCWDDSGWEKGEG